MLKLPDSWVWDTWYAQDGDTYHAFFLYASRALGDPDRRHGRASLGHAVSRDLVHWERVADALVHADTPAFDQSAIWTGCVVRGDDDRWYLFYTGMTATGSAFEQRIGLAVSDDLYAWRRASDGPIVEPDARWYELTGGTDRWSDQHWRDPWVFRDPSGRGWHMLITARAKDGDLEERGVLAHATSDDLLAWTVQPPLTEPGTGFGFLEVPQGPPKSWRCARPPTRPGPRSPTTPTCARPSWATRPRRRRRSKGSWRSARW